MPDDGGVTNCYGMSAPRAREALKDQDQVIDIFRFRF